MAETAGGALILFAWLAARGRWERTTAAQWRVAALVVGAVLLIRE